MLRIDVITVFPAYLVPLHQSLLGKAIDRGQIDIGLHDLRQWSHDVHNTVDDSPYGGGPGMVMRPEPWGEALDQVLPDDAVLIVPTPAGELFDQVVAEQLSRVSHLVFACGRYEGIDQRVIHNTRQRARVLELSIGDYVLAGGEVATLVMVEAITRLIPGVLGNIRSAAEDSHSDGLLEGPSYTRPEVWRDLAVPPVLRSGNHAAIDRWRRDESLRRTAVRRPDLIGKLQPETMSAHDNQVVQDAQIEQTAAHEE